MFDNAKVRRISETTKHFQLNNVNRNVKNRIDPSRGSATKYCIIQGSNLTEIITRSHQGLASGILWDKLVGSIQIKNREILCRKSLYNYSESFV